MSSSFIYYRFKSQRTPSRIAFDGTGLSVYDLKREILLQNRIAKAFDFDLAIYNNDDEEYKDDNATVPRSTQVLVRRLPPSRGPGRGNAAQYVADTLAGGSGSGGGGGTEASGVAGLAAGGGAARGAQGGRDAARPAVYRGPMSTRFDGKDERDRAGTSSVTPAPAVLSSAVTEQHMGEANKIAAMFQATTENWDETQERMSQATYRDRGGGIRRGGPPRPVPSAGGHAAAPPIVHDRPPPVGYICFRCGTKGHWIQDCPTNEDRSFDDKPRFKRTTGIPKSMLKTVENPTELDRSAGVMVTADGQYVIAQVDSASWERTRAQRKPLTRSDVYQMVPTDPSLACPICSKLLRQAVKTPCCATLYCEECIQNHLLEHDFTCAECERRVPDLAEVKADDEVRRRVQDYVDAEIERSERKIDEEEEAEEQGQGQGQEQASEEQAAREAASGGAEAGKPTSPTTAAAAAAAEANGREAADGEPAPKRAKVEERTGTPPTRAGDAKPSTTAGATVAPPRHGLPARPQVAVPSPSPEPADGDGAVKPTDTADGASSSSSSVPPPRAAVAKLPPWNPSGVQQVVLLLSNPNLPPAMRVQLQMQLQALQMQFVGVLQAWQQQQQQQQVVVPPHQQHHRHRPAQAGAAMGMGMGMGAGAPPPLGRVAVNVGGGGAGGIGAGTGMPQAGMTSGMARPMAMAPTASSASAAPSPSSVPPAAAAAAVGAGGLASLPQRPTRAT